jgi:hypothetical protein
MTWLLDGEGGRVGPPCLFLRQKHSTGLISIGGQLARVYCSEKLAIIEFIVCF